MTGSTTADLPDRLLGLWKKPLVRAALLVVAVILAYWPAAMNGGYIWDDDVYVTDNPLLPAPDGLRRIWFSLDSPSQYFPLVYTTFRAEYAIWHLNPVGYHWVNVVLHIANALLVWRLLARLRVPGAWLAAMIFALHPVQVESVAWITERKNTLSTYFFLLTLLLWTEFIDEQSRRKWTYYAFALACSAMALFAKTTACTIPASLVLIIWLQQKPVTRRRILEMVPFGALGVGMGLVTVWWERFHQGTQGKLFDLGLADRILIASHAVWFYLGKLLLPVNLTFSYPHWTLHPWNPLSYGWLLAGVVLCYAIYCAREDLGRGPEVAAAFFVATLSPMLGFIMLYTFRYSFVADHYQYAACIGPIALASAGIVKWADAAGEFRRTVFIGAGALLLALGMQTWHQCHIYQNSETIWIDTLKKNPGSLMANYNLANELAADKENGNLGESLLLYNRAVTIDPTFSFTRVNRAQTLAALGRNAEATADFDEAVRLDPDNAIAQNEYGLFLRKMRDPADAAVHFQKAVDIQPQVMVYRKNLADALVANHDFAGALPQYQEIERYFPAMPQSHLELGPIWLALGKPAEAIREYREAMGLDPKSADARMRLAWLLATSTDAALRDPAEALKLAESANELTNHGNPIALNTLAAAYAAGGRLADATTACMSALEAARNAGDRQLAAFIEGNLRVYQSGRTLFQPASQ